MNSHFLHLPLYSLRLYEVSYSGYHTLNARAVFFNDGLTDFFKAECRNRILMILKGAYSAFYKRDFNFIFSHTNSPLTKNLFYRFSAESGNLFNGLQRL